MVKQTQKTTKKTVKSVNATVKKSASGKRTIIVKNADGDPDTTATILVQNKIDYVPKVSVIIPVYNVEQYLRECLDSVVNQTLKEIEIICVDDGSVDNSLEILKEYAKKDTRITVITQKNLHAGVARNAGLAVAKGEYLSFLDSDDFFKLNMLEETYKKGITSKADIVMFNCYLFDDATKENKEFEWTLDIKNVPSVFNYRDIPDRIFKLSNCWVWNRLYKHDFINKNKIFFPVLAITEDTYFSCWASVLAKRITYLPTRYVHYRINRITKTNATSVQFRMIRYLDVLTCMYKLYKKFKDLNCYSTIESCYLQLICENIYWSIRTYDKEPEIKQKVISYFIKHFQDIFVYQKMSFKNKENNKKYTKLRNILVDAGIYKEIPKRIFYVWGANEPIRPEVQQMIDTWEKYLPDYDIVQINDESTQYFNFQHELQNNKWFRTVYERKMWAYVADYVRVKTLYDNGGIYFDTDVSVVQNMDKFLREPAFVGIQMSSLDGTGDWVEPAICGAQKHNKFFGKVASFYDELIWKEPIYTMPHLFNYYLRKEDVDIFPFPIKEKQKIIKLKDITIYPECYFIPYRFRSNFTPQCIESKTHTIHHWGGSWTKPEVISFLENKNKILLANDMLQQVVLTSTADVQQYRDENGNFIKIPCNKQININMYGKNNTIVIDSDIDAKKTVVIKVVGNNNLIIIGASSSELWLFCGFKDFNRYTNNAMFVMGKNNCSHRLDCLLEENDTSITIGDDNLFSWGIELRCSDSHTIIDLENNVLNRAESISIGNHNWVCKDVLFLKNSAITNDSVVACRSLVTGKITDSNVLIAGTPAKIVKEKIAWNGDKPDVYGTNLVIDIPKDDINQSSLSGKTNTTQETKTQCSKIVRNQHKHKIFYKERRENGER